MFPDKGEPVPPAGDATEYFLDAVVCHGASHYVCYVRYSEATAGPGGWVLFDDKLVRVIGTMEDVSDHIKKSRFAPTVLLFQLPAAAKAAWLRDGSNGLFIDMRLARDCFRRHVRAMFDAAAPRLREVSRPHPPWMVPAVSSRAPGVLSNRAVIRLRLDEDCHPPRGGQCASGGAAAAAGGAAVGAAGGWEAHGGGADGSDGAASGAGDARGGHGGAGGSGPPPTPHDHSLGPADPGVSGWERRPEAAAPAPASSWPAGAMAGRPWAGVPPDPGAAGASMPHGEAAAAGSLPRQPGDGASAVVVHSQAAAAQAEAERHKQCLDDYAYAVQLEKAGAASPAEVPKAAAAAAPAAGYDAELLRHVLPGTVQRKQPKPTGPAALTVTEFSKWSATSPFGASSAMLGNANTGDRRSWSEIPSGVHALTTGSRSGILGKLPRSTVAQLDAIGDALRFVSGGHPALGRFE